MQYPAEAEMKKIREKLWSIDNSMIIVLKWDNKNPQIPPHPPPPHYKKMPLMGTLSLL